MIIRDLKYMFIKTNPFKAFCGSIKNGQELGRFKNLPQQMIKFNLIIVIALCFLTFSCTSIIRNKLTKNNFKEIKTNPINTFETFYWSNDTILGVYSEKVALYIPVKLDDLDEKVLFQLDLGSVSSELYQKSLNLTDCKKKDSLGYLWNLNFNINNNISTIKKIYLNKKLGGNEQIDKKLKLGNIGLDYFLNKILVLDYKNNKFLVTDSLEDTFFDDFIEVKNASINKFPILLETKLNGKKSKVMFDTGSSMIEFMTYPEKFEKLKGESIVKEKCCVKSFGKDYTLSEVITNNTLEIFNKEFTNLKISNTSKFLGDKQAVFGMKLLGIDGITGNKFLLDKIIILNFKENKLWIK